MCSSSPPSTPDLSIRLLSQATVHIYTYSSVILITSLPEHHIMSDNTNLVRITILIRKQDHISHEEFLK
jgi:hypothetical protein